MIRRECFAWIIFIRPGPTLFCLFCLFKLALLEIPYISMNFLFALAFSLFSKSLIFQDEFPPFVSLWQHNFHFRTQRISWKAWSTYTYIGKSFALDRFREFNVCGWYKLFSCKAHIWMKLINLRIIKINKTKFTKNIHQFVCGGFVLFYDQITFRFVRILQNFAKIWIGLNRSCGALWGVLLNQSIPGAPLRI